MNEQERDEADLAGELTRLRAVLPRSWSRRKRSRETLARFTARVAGADTASTVLNAFCEESDRLLGWDFCHLAYRKPEKDSYRMATLWIRPTGRRGFFRARISRWPVSANRSCRFCREGAFFINRTTG